MIIQALCQPTAVQKWISLQSLAQHVAARADFPRAAKTCDSPNPCAAHKN
jgi:hypothetical protein